MAAVADRYVNPLPNPARYKKGNAATLDQVCEAAYQGDLESLEILLKSGNEETVFNGDINMHHTDVNALHMAALAGQKDCVKLLLDAGADPHVKTRVPEGKEPKSGETARQKAEKLGHKNVVDMLKKAEDSVKPGWYQPDGIGNNRKLYSEPKPRPVAPAAPAAAPAPKAAAKTGAPKAPSGPPLPVALLFPGQGSQYVKMLDGVKDIPEVKEMLEEAKSILGYDLLDLCLQGPEDKLAETRYCQPAMFVGGLAGICKLRQSNPDEASRAKCMAGLSLGEYTALCAAGVIDFADGLRLVKLRGEAMQEAASVGKQAMVSVAGLDRAVLDGLCKDAASSEGSGAVCQVANVLFPKGFSVAGTETAMMKLKDLAEGKGALQAKVLKTSGGFHTSLMQPAQVKLQQALNELLPKMRPPNCTVYMNVTGEPLAAGTDPKVIVDLLSKQLVSPVQWEPSVQRMIADGITGFYECGPQKQITAMMKRISPKAWKATTTTEV
mmetsp:Transcript_3347/g.7911  ORF Transcript_3347/g.7911 Transcript_3347/m.7911 type:complete len:495 (+) Transcript_3347:76-1560(+)